MLLTDANLRTLELPKVEVGFPFMSNEHPAVSVQEVQRVLAGDDDVMFPFTYTRTRKSKGQRVIAMTVEHAEQLRATRSMQGYLTDPKDGRELTSPAIDNGQFYVIQLVPDLQPLRVKLGFAGSVSARLVNHRTAAPTAELVRVWPCMRAWETSAIASITRIGCRSLGLESFDCDDLDALLNRADAFFALMPALIAPLGGLDDT